MDYKNMYRKIERRYIIVAIILFLILISKQSIIHYQINHEIDMSRVINIAGRQRMLSQRISKDSLMIYKNDYKDNLNYYVKDLKASLEIFKESQQDLIEGTINNRSIVKNSKEIDSIFIEINPYFEKIIKSSNEILNIVEQENYSDESILEEIKIITENENNFLIKMNKIVYQYDKETKDAIVLIEKTQLILFILIILSGAFITIFVFLPGTKSLKQAFIDINNSNENSRKLFYSVKGALFIVGKDGDIKIMNSDAEKMINSKIKDKKTNNIGKDLNWIDLDIIEIIEKVKMGQEFDSIETKIEDGHTNKLDVILSIISGSYNKERAVLVSAFDISDQKKAEAILKNISIKDELTGLYNRRFLETIISLEIEKSKRYDFPISAAIFDLDDFKMINDKWGHPVGDIVLKESADVLKKNLRESDYLIRIGGEEFIVIMTHTNLDGAFFVAEKLRKSIEMIDNKIVGPFTGSFGVAELGKSESYDELYKRIDAALYEAKKSGKNCVKKSIIKENLNQDSSLLWKKSWNSGEKEIDFQHRQLFDLLSKEKHSLLELKDEKLVIKNIDLIIGLIEEHFIYEEKVLEDIKYDELLNHKKLHKNIIEKVYLLKEKLISGEEKLEDVLEEIFHDFILGHHLIEDTKFFPLL